MSDSDDVTRFHDLVAKWISYRSSLPEPQRYNQIRNDLFKVRNPDLNGNPSLSYWPDYLIDSDESMMAAVEHYFLCRAWVGTGTYPAWEMRGLNGIYDLSKFLKITPRANPNKPVSPLTSLQRQAQAEGVAAGEIDLKKSGGKAPLITQPPKYW
ncbi:MAG: hypothetical protein FWF20_12700 [Betaproteobacteria bacterium]|nr:hypothetical protein [Betaproteobacteria bacterium]